MFDTQKYHILHRSLAPKTLNHHPKFLLFFKHLANWQYLKINVLAFWLNHRHNTTTRPDRYTRFLLAGVAVLGRHIGAVRNPLFHPPTWKFKRPYLSHFLTNFKKIMTCGIPTKCRLIILQWNNCKIVIQMLREGWSSNHLVYIAS